MKNMNWALPSETFAHFAQLLSLTTYTRSVLLGLTVSVGGLTESLVRVHYCTVMDFTICKLIKYGYGFKIHV